MFNCLKKAQTLTGRIHTTICGELSPVGGSSAGRPLQVTALIVRQAAPVFVPDTSVSPHGRAPRRVSDDSLPVNRSTLDTWQETGGAFMLDVDRISDSHVTFLRLWKTPCTCRTRVADWSFLQWKANQAQTEAGSYRPCYKLHLKATHGSLVFSFNTVFINGTITPQTPSCKDDRTTRRQKIPSNSGCAFYSFILDLVWIVGNQQECGDNT